MPSSTRLLAAIVLILSLAVGCGGSTIPRAAIEHNTAGSELFAAGDLERAEARFRLALEFHPGFAEAHANLGLVALARGQLAEAEAHLRGAIGLREDFGEAWGNLGVVLERRGRLDAAEEAYERALSIHPGITFARRALAWLLVRTGRLVEARAHLLRLLELAPDDAEAAGLLAWCELRLDRPQSARDIVDRALETDPEARAPRFVRGLLRARANELDGALADLEPLREDERLGREATVRVAAVWLLLDRADDALRAMEELLAHDPENPAAHLVAASAALSTGAWPRARHHASEALRVQPRLESALIALADACAHQGDPECARSALDRVSSRSGPVAREVERIRATLEATSQTDRRRP
jgi:tetratricopeptide (TPR) repeat protein